MKKFVVNLFSNRFGIFLATVNVCYFLLRPYFQRVFEHNHGESCFVFKGFFLFPVNLTNVDDLMILQNLPATILSFFPRFLINDLTPGFCVYTQIKFHFIFFASFIVIQWLFIGWLAKTLAAKISPPEL